MLLVALVGRPVVAITTILDSIFCVHVFISHLHNLGSELGGRLLDICVAISSRVGEDGCFTDIGLVLQSILAILVSFMGELYQF